MSLFVWLQLERCWVEYLLPQEALRIVCAHFSNIRALFAPGAAIDRAAKRLLLEARPPKEQR